MKNIKYFFESIIIFIFLIIFKISGYKLASEIGSILGIFFGPIFRSKKKIVANLKKAIPNLSDVEINSIIKNMWSNYGRILSEYVYLKNFRNSKLDKHLVIQGKEILNEIKNNSEKVIFVSGHFNNFELMAMQIEKSGINLAAIYRPLNNIFLNKIMENIREKHICKKQIKKGISGMRELLKLYKDGYSVALMIDQRVSEGIKSNFFNHPASTTTIPAQLIKKFKCKVVPIYIERIDKINFKMTINNPIMFEQNLTIEEITEKLNKWLENKILQNPEQWIWSHGRWK